MTGHVRRRGERSWELKFDVGTDPLSGKRVTKYQSFKGTKREAQAELGRLIEAARRGDYVDPSKTTLGEFLDRWERDWAAMNVSPKTRERYIELLRVHVRPHLGALAIQKLQPVHLAELYAKLRRDSGLSPRTVGRVPPGNPQGGPGGAGMGCRAAQCCRRGEAAEGAESAEIEILGEDQVRELLGRLRGRTLYPIAVLALATGMRRGELPCGGVMSISMAARFASNNHLSRRNPAFASSRLRPSTGAAPSPCPLPSCRNCALIGRRNRNSGSSSASARHRTVRWSWPIVRIPMIADSDSN